MKERLERLDALRVILQIKPSAGQDELRLSLGTAGYFISQPQLSKDLKRIHAKKTMGIWTYTDDNPRVKHVIDPEIEVKVREKLGL